MNTDHASTTQPETGHPPRNMKKTAAASVIGTTVEWYDLSHLRHGFGPGLQQGLLPRLRSP
ncbi:hypothetical protein ACU4GD_00175 [Cupriavidus basilensis]